MTDYKIIFENNRKWVESKLAEHKEYFEKLARDQPHDFIYKGFPFETKKGLLF